jgi:TetR/AcrR family transcriptional regulator, regulator of cefoperazone and chloramphenicol sensitivity
MKIPKKGSEKTCNNLLAVASEIFAEKGYRDTTIAEISRRAGTNVASVNYHFGDKETLYRESWRRSFLESVKAHPPDGGVSDDAPPKVRLRGQVSALLRRIADENNREFLIVQKELANPTGLLEEVIHEEIRPLQERMRAVIRELLGANIPERLVQFCEISVISQCINPMVVRSGRKGKREHEIDHPGIDDIEAYSRHIIEFSLAGIAAIRKAGE